jgi:hypothetical protein
MFGEVPMPVSKKQSGLFARIGKRIVKGHELHKSDETRIGGGGDLPAGIDHGIAQLVECKFDMYKSGDFQGEYFFYAAGVVKQPKKLGDLPVEGLRTSIMEPMCDTPNRKRATVEDHLDFIYNEFRKLGINTEEIDPEDIEQIAASLKEAQPHFRFRTWQGDKQTTGPYAGKEPLIQHDWRGACDYEEDGDGAGEDVIDETAGEEEDDPSVLAAAADAGEQEAQKKLTDLAIAADIDPAEFDTWEAVAEAIAAPVVKKASLKPKAKPAKVVVVEEEPEEEPEEEEEVEDDISLPDLGDLADDNGDEDAMVKLTEAAAEAELDPDDYETWAELAAALVKLRVEATQGEEGEWAPEAGEVYLYKTNPKAKKATECEVVLVLGAKQLVNLKSLDDGKIFKAVKWDALENV